MRRRIAVRFAAVVRWLHIYVSMLGLAAVLFFSVTGITLNHPDWFPAAAEQQSQATGEIRKEWLGLDADGKPKGPDDPVSRLEIVEHLRATHGVRGALADFRIDELECVVTFKGPGYAADAFVNRETGRYELTQTSHGFIALINDLHKGRDTGKAWSVVIDASAIVLTIISLTGLILIFYLKLKRKPGLVVGLVGTVALVAVVVYLVP